MILKSEKIVVIIKVLILLIGSSNILIALYKEISLILKSNKLVFMIQGLVLLIGSASKSNFWQYFNRVILGNLIDFEIEQTSFYY